MRRRIYVASSWRNIHQQDVVRVLRVLGHEVYDFREPKPGESGFNWRDIDPNWQQWTLSQYREALDHQIARDGYALDIEALAWCDTLVLVNPCGRSSHGEWGQAVGAGKPTCIYLHERDEPELMYKMASALVVSDDELVAWVRSL